MSPKQSSLALDERKEQDQESHLNGFEPTLDLIITRSSSSHGIIHGIVEIAGRVTVSF